MDTKAILRTIGTHLLAALVAGILVFFLKPAQVQMQTTEKVKVVEVEKQVVVTQEKVRVEVVRIKDTQVADRLHKEHTETKSPDGTVVVKDTEDHNIDSVVHDNQNTVQVKVVEVEKQVVVKEKEEVQIIQKPVLAQWHVGALVGLAPRFDSPQLSPLMVGVEAERRIVGPFFLGAWVMGGSPVVGPPSLTNVAAGIKLAGEF